MTDRETEEIEVVIEDEGLDQDQEVLTEIEETLVVGETDSEVETGNQKIIFFDGYMYICTDFQVCRWSILKGNHTPYYTCKL